VIRRHLWLLLVLALTGGALFQALVYLELQTTTEVNGVAATGARLVVWSRQSKST
jgi:hypothetical protein